MAGALAAAPLAACGQSEEDRIQGTVQKFFDAERAGDVDTLCDLFANSVSNQFKRARRSCPKVLKQAGAGKGNAKVTVGQVSRDQDDRASVVVKFQRGAAPATTRQIALLKEGGGWKIASGL